MDSTPITKLTKECPVKTKCPNCDSVMPHLDIENIEGKGTSGNAWKCITYSCPSCHKAISAQIDPIAIRADTISALRK